MIEKILPALITIIGNVIFYLLIKGRIDKSIEKNRIAYSGVFKEKIIIYRELLKKTYEIKKELNRFIYAENTKIEGAKLMSKINDYIQFYSINQPFISDEMLTDLNKIRSEFQEVFEKFYMYHPNNNSNELKEFFKTKNKINSNKSFKEIEDRIILEMQKDLKISKFNE